MQDDLDIEGLDYLQWSLFDSPDEKEVDISLWKENLYTY